LVIVKALVTLGAFPKAVVLRRFCHAFALATVAVLSIARAVVLRVAIDASTKRAVGIVRAKLATAAIIVTIVVCAPSGKHAFLAGNALWAALSIADAVSIIITKEA
jgi:hypothetical protein